MQTRTRTRPSRERLLDRDIERLRKHLARFEPLTKKRSASALAELDTATERLLGAVFGPTSDQVTMYQYAQAGEAESMLNLPEEAQEDGAHDLTGESIRQRKRVVESCVWELEARRAAVPKRSRAVTRSVPKVSDYMTEEVRSIHLNATLRDAGQLLEQYKIGLLFVDDHKRYIGVITDTLLSRRAVARGLDPKTTPVKSCMSADINSIEDNESIMEAVKLMKEKGVRHLAVSKNQTIVGILSISDVVRYYSGVQ